MEGKKIFSPEKENQQKNMYKRNFSGKSKKDSYMKIQKKKFRWHDGTGKKLTAGGLLPYDDNGIWVIGEKKTKNGNIEWTDPGGKYKFEDCDIYTTISREFCEELYHSSEITRGTIIEIKDVHTPTYVDGHLKIPVYICYSVHVDFLRKYGVILDPDLFKENRKKTLSENPDVPAEYYNSVELKHISFVELEKAFQRGQKSQICLSFRLKRILKYGPLSKKINIEEIESHISERDSKLDISHINNISISTE